MLSASRRCRWVSMGAGVAPLEVTGSGATRASISGPYSSCEKIRVPGALSLRGGGQAGQGEGAARYSWGACRDWTAAARPTGELGPAFAASEASVRKRDDGAPRDVL